MTKETGGANFLILSVRFAKINKHSWIKGARRLKLFPVLTTVILFILTILAFSPVQARAEPEEKSGARVEGFSLFRYKDELTWKLTGKRANEGDGDLVVRDFELLVWKSGTREGESLYEFSGEEIRLNSTSGTDTADIPEKVELEIQDEFRGVAESAMYDFSTGKVSGNGLKLTRTGNGVETSLRGKSFEYGYKSEELKITEGFQVVIAGSGDGRTEISGEALAWTPGKEIYTEGNVVARTVSGWELSAEEVRWNPEGESLECSGSVEAVKSNTRIQGDFMTYDRKEEKIRVNKARMVIKDK